MICLILILVTQFCCFDNGAVPLDCKTTLIITDCADQGVEGVTVTVERCSDRKAFFTITDSKGQAFFALCKKEICKTKLSFVGAEPKEVPKVGDDCKGDKCTIKLCSN